MATNLDDVLKSAMALSTVDRLRLAADLMDSVPDDPPGFAIDDPELLTEVEARSRDGSAGVPWADVQAQLRRDLDA
jgi:putative addiction module component (TIGR02574 family)